MKIPKLKDLFFQLDRLEYPGNPETLQSGLAWSLVENRQNETTEQGLKIGYIYEKFKNEDYRNIAVEKTRTDHQEGINRCLTEIQNVVEILGDIKKDDVIKALLNDLIEWCVDSKPPSILFTFWVRDSIARNGTKNLLSTSSTFSE